MKLAVSAEIPSSPRPRGFSRRSARWVAGKAPAALLAGFLLSGCALAGPTDGDILVFDRPETQIDYEVDLSGAPTEEIEALLETSLAVYRRQDDGAQSLAFLRRRAEADAPTVQKILRSFGYYEAQARIEVDGADDDGDGEPDRAVVRVVVEPGRAYELASHEIVATEAGETPVPPLDAQALGSPIGKTAVARAILDAETAAVTSLRQNGRPYAERKGREATADPETAEIAVATTIAAGPHYVYGDTVFSGLETVESDYLETYRPWTPGETYDEAQIAEYQRALAGTGLFEAATVRAPETPPEAEAAPIEVLLVEAPHRTVSGGLRYDTDIGPAARGTFEHRNLFGANETLALIAEIGLEEQRFETTYRIPQFNRPGQDFASSLELRRIEDQAFDEVGVTGAAGLERKIDEHLVAGIGGLAEISFTQDQDEDGASYLLGVPAFARFDNSNDRLNPTKGYRARVSATPFIGAFDGAAATFFTLDAAGSTYLDLTGSGRYVLAGRTRLASIIAEDVADVPPQRRLYAGGGGSVRGFQERFIGPLDEDGDPAGGLSAIELRLEMRVQATEQIGFVVFSDAGAVSEEPAPIFDDGVQFALGGGLRYFSPIGPLRFDIAAPVDRRPEDDRFQFYISLGQAF